MPFRRTLVAAAVLVVLGVVGWLLLPGGGTPAPVVPPVPGSTAPPDARPPRHQPTEPRTAPPEPTDESDGGAETPSAPELLVRVAAAGSGEPIEGADVVLVGGEDEEAAPTAHTDARGEAHIADVAAGDVTIRVRAAGCVRAEVGAVAVAGEVVGIDVRLMRGVALAGVVLDDRTGEPIRGAHVVVTKGGSRGGAFSMSFEGPFGRAQTDALGKFRIDGVEPGVMVTVRAAAQRHAETALTVLLEREATEPRQVELRLPAAAILRGVVRYPDGRAAAGASVYAVPADAPDLLLANPTSVSSSGGRTIRALRGEAGEGGDYEVSGLDLGAVYTVLAVLDAFGRSDLHSDVSPTEVDPQPRVDLVLRPGPTLTVRVVGPDGEPQSEGNLLLFGDGFPVELELREPGVFVAASPPPAKYTLRVTCPGLLIQEIPVEIEPSEQKELDVRLEAGFVLAGVLVDDLGEPVAKQTIWVDRHWQDAGKLPLSRGRTETDAEGRFRIDGLRSGPHFLGLVLGRHDVPADLRLEPPADDLRVVVMRRGAVRARIALPAETPAPDKVGVRVGRGEDGSFGESGHGVAWNGGELELESIPPGACRLRFQIAGLMEAVRHVTVKPGETLDLGLITMERGLDLEGRVQDRAGRPVVGAEVTAGLIWTPSHRVVATDRDGRFALGGFANGENEIEVSGEGFLPRVVTVSLPVAVPLVVTLDAGCEVTLRTTSAAGNPAPGTNVRWTPVVEGEDVEGDDADETDHRGVLVLRLREGRWRFDVLDDEWEPVASRTVDVTEGGAMDVEISLPR